MSIRLCVSAVQQLSAYFVFLVFCVYVCRYDRILVDAPCSSDRHVIQDSGEMLSWSPARTKQFALRQTKILMSALKSLKAGGICVYSTCSLSPLENDAVVEKILKKFSAPAADTKTKSKSKFCSSASPSSNLLISVVDPANAASSSLCSPICERTKYGVIILPDNAFQPGWGPLYIAILQRPQQKQNHDDDSDQEEDEDEDEEDEGDDNEEERQ